MKRFAAIVYSALLAVVGFAVFAGCGSGGGGGIVVSSLNQAAYNINNGRYEYGYNSIGNIKITGAPEDTDWNRWAMLHDGETYRLYFFKQGSTDTIYQFGYTGVAYEYGYNSYATLTISHAPSGADTASFAMLHDGTTYRLYLKDKNDPTLLYQFGFDGSKYEYGYNSISSIRIVSSPADTDHSRWAMLNDGSYYRYYAFKQGSETEFYQFGFNGSSYEYGYASIARLSVSGMPSNSLTDSFAMLHDGENYRFYFRAP